MSIPSFASLTVDEQHLLFKAPALVAVLVAGADEQIDEKEEALAQKLVSYRTFTSETQLHDYYEVVNEQFETALGEAMQAWKANGGNGHLSSMLAGVNPILPKLDAAYAKLLKDSWRSYARKVAEASGGFLGMGSVSKEELQVVDLPMIE
ncbi:MAG: hypothetical protein AAF399_07085 [Bacteroidota bacterium]